MRLNLLRPNLQLILLLTLLVYPISSEFKVYTTHALHHLTFEQTQQNKQSHSYRSSSYYGGGYGGVGVGQILSGFVLGPIIFVMAFVLIWYNEKKAALDYSRISLAGDICLDVNPYDKQTIYPANQKLVHIAGDTATSETIGDRLSGIHCNNSIKIVRKVEVNQWRATVTNYHNNRTVIHHLGWQTDNQPQVEGRHNPPENWFVKGQEITAQQVRVGEFLLSEDQKKKCSKVQILYPSPDNAFNIARNCQRMQQPIVQNQYIYFPSPQGGSINDHGALRINYHRCPVGQISIMAKCQQNSFTGFPIAAYQNNGVVQKNQLPDCCFISNCVAECLKPIEEIDFLEEEKLTRAELVEKNINRSICYAWIMRLIGFLMIISGIWLFFSPMVNLLGYIPLVGGFLSTAIGIIIFLAAVIVAIPLFIIALSIAWLRFHPKIGLILLTVALLILGIILALNFIGKGRQNNSQQAVHMASQMTMHIMRSSE